MKILFTQESDWFERNPIIQHHLLEIMSLRGHEIRVIDFELLWSRHKYELFSRRKVFYKATRVNSNAKITLIRPAILKIPILDYVSVLFSHKEEIKRQMREWSPDILVGVAILNSYWGARAARKANIPFIYYWFELMHCLIPVKQFRFLGKIVEKMALKNASVVLATTDNLRNAISKMGVPANNIKVLKYGVSTELYHPGVTGDSVRAQYGLKKDDIVLFFMGWLYHFSGLKEVCTALSKSQNPKLKLLIVGDGDAYEDLINIRDKYRLAGRVILTGKKPLSEIPSHVAAADICLLPAYNNETMKDIVPAKVYEYMAGGKVTISTELPGVMNEFGDNGIVYVKNPEDVVQKALDLVNSRSCEELGINAKKFVERYAWNNIADEFERILNESVKTLKQS